MIVYTEFINSIIFGIAIAVINRFFFRQQKSLLMAALFGLMGALVGWLQGAILADHMDWLYGDNTSNSLYRVATIGICVALYVIGFQRWIKEKHE